MFRLESVLFRQTIHDIVPRVFERLSNTRIRHSALSHAYLSDRIFIKKIERRKAGYFLTADNALSRRAEVNYNFR